MKRAVNKKYWFLDDIDLVFEELQRWSITEYALVLIERHALDPDCFHSLRGCVRFIIRKNLTVDQLALVKQQRRFKL